jgi:hypothetical protein
MVRFCDEVSQIAERRRAELLAVILPMALGGKTQNDIALELNRRGVYTPNGKAWGGVGINQLLQKSARWREHRGKNMVANE